MVLGHLGLSMFPWFCSDESLIVLKGAILMGANQPTRQKSQRRSRGLSLDGDMVEAPSGPGARCKPCNHRLSRSGQEGGILAGVAVAPASFRETQNRLRLPLWGPSGAA